MLTANDPLLLLLLAIVISGVIAAVAGRDFRYWPWGLAGPFGWMIAAILGLRDSLDLARREGVVVERASRAG